MSFNVVNTFQTFFDSTGKPRSGGWITFYVNRTDTLGTIFSDEALTVAQTNPYQLDASGRIAGDVKYSGLRTLKITNEDLSDVRTDDDVTTVEERALPAAVISEWIVGASPTYVSATSFTLGGDHRKNFHVERRVETANTGGIIYSTITDVAFAASITTVTVVNDTGILDSGLNAVSYGIISAENSSISQGAVTPILGPDIASATALPYPAYGTYSDVTGTTTITSFDTSGEIGTVIKRHFDGILTLTHDATDLILPGGVNIITAVGDEAEFVEYASGDWRCTNYLYIKKDGYIKLSDVKSSGTGGGTNVAATWTTRTLNTEDNDAGGFCTLSSSQFTLLSGTYRINASSQMATVIRHKARIRNISDNNTTIVGTNTATTTGVQGTNSIIMGEFTISATKTFALQYYAQTSVTNNGLGYAVSSGESEIYATVELLRISS